MLRKIIYSASELLRPGGWFIGTHDLKSDFLPDRLKVYFDFHRECGLDLGDIPEPATLDIDWEYSLIENPATVMLHYQAETPEETRKYEGHWTTMFTAAQKRSLQQQNESLQQQNESLQQQNESLQQQNESLQQQNESLQQQNESLQQQNESLQQQNESLQQQNESLQQHIAAMESSKFWKLRTLWFRVKQAFT